MLLKTREAPLYLTWFYCSYWPEGKCRWKDLEFVSEKKRERNHCFLLLKNQGLIADFKSRSHKYLFSHQALLRVLLVSVRDLTDSVLVLFPCHIVLHGQLSFLHLVVLCSGLHWESLSSVVRTKGCSKGRSPRWRQRENPACHEDTAPQGFLNGAPCFILKLFFKMSPDSAHIVLWKSH